MILKHISQASFNTILKGEERTEGLKYTLKALVCQLATKFLCETKSSHLLMTRPQAMVRIKDCEYDYAFDRYEINGYTYDDQPDTGPIRYVSVDEVLTLCKEFHYRTHANPTHIFLPPNCRILAHQQVRLCDTDNLSDDLVVYGLKPVPNAHTLAVGIL